MEGTGRVLRDVQPPVAGKTGTAEVQNKPSHSWFVGFAPYGGTGRQIAFSVIVENGGYGARAAAPIAGGLVAAVRDLGSFELSELARPRASSAGRPETPTCDFRLGLSDFLRPSTSD